MHDTVVNSGWDAMLIAIPFLGIMFAGFFRLDEVIAAPKRRLKTRHLSGGLGQDGQPALFDPDGQPWREPQPQRELQPWMQSQSQIEARVSPSARPGL
jgi:hypothetical protein